MTEREGVYHHPDAAAPQKHTSRQLLSIVIRQLRLELYKAKPSISKEIHRLDLNLAELVGCGVEGMVLVLLQREGVLER